MPKPVPMPMRSRILLLALALLIALPTAASAIVEKKSETEFPDEVSETLDGESYTESYTMVATGVALREKTMLKVDVYAIVSYLDATVTLEGDKAAALITIESPKRLQMEILRGFSKDKLVKSFTDIIDKNYDDDSAFAEDLAIFLAYFEKDAEEGDELIFDYHPAVGLKTSVNGELKGTIENSAFTEALWTVWFGEKPANKGMKESLLEQAK